MKTKLLQIDAAVSGLMDYGILGIFMIIVLFIGGYIAKVLFAWTQEDKAELKRLHEINASEIKMLRDEQKKYLEEDRKALIEIQKESIKTIENSNQVMEKLMGFLEKKT